MTSLTARPIWRAENLLILLSIQLKTVIFGESREFFSYFSVDLERYVAKFVDCSATL